MIAAVVNAVVVVLGGFLGLLFGGKLKEVHTETIVNALGICVIVIGITSAIVTSNILIVIICLVIGTIFGELLKICQFCLLFRNIPEFHLSSSR